MTALMKFKSRIAGKNADVALYPDRIEWSRVGHRWFVWLPVALCTMCISLIWLRPGRRSTEMVPLKAVTSVTSQEETFVTSVVLTVSGNTIAIRADKSTAREFMDRVQAIITA